MRKVKILLAIPIVLAFTMFLAGCATSSLDETNLAPEGDKTAPGASTSEEEPAPPEEPGDPPDRLDLRLTQISPPGLERVETPEAAPVIGEVPAEILDEVLADLVERSGADREEIQVIRAEAVVWNDGSLGCPKPGEVYIQVLINGYWVVLEVEGSEYDYRATDTGNFKLCEGILTIDPVTPPLPSK